MVSVFHCPVPCLSFSYLMPLSHEPKYPGYGDFQVFRSRLSNLKKNFCAPKTIHCDTENESSHGQGESREGPVCCVWHDLAQGRVNQDCALLTCFCGVLNYSSAALQNYSSAYWSSSAIVPPVQNFARVYAALPKSFQNHYQNSTSRFSVKNESSNVECSHTGES